jgi:hypothetical protein
MTMNNPPSKTLTDRFLGFLFLLGDTVIWFFLLCGGYALALPGAPLPAHAIGLVAFSMLIGRLLEITRPTFPAA